VSFKGKAKAFTSTHDFLATILPYGLQEWEKLSIFLNFLIAKLPAPKEQHLAKGILDAIDMDSYRAEKKATMAIALPDADAEIEPVPTSGGGRKPEPQMDKFPKQPQLPCPGFNAAVPPSSRRTVETADSLPSAAWAGNR
jgi:type I restriction enzyme R subunit